LPFGHNNIRGAQAREEIQLRDRIDALELNLDEATEALHAAVETRDELEHNIEQRENRIAQLEQQCQFTEASLRDTEQLLGAERASAARARFHSRASHDSSQSPDLETLQAERASLKKTAAEAQERAEQAENEKMKLQLRLAEVEQSGSQLRLQLDDAVRRMQLVRGFVGQTTATDSFDRRALRPKTLRGHYARPVTHHR
jgi:multidrug resistance efflux pump